MERHIFPLFSGSSDTLSVRLELLKDKIFESEEGG